ncbi:MAG: mycofactocin precursor [Dehalococcoidales bacterium]|nr:mycofactocin precursor [Dehalococcoidales bacterium]
MVVEPGTHVQAEIDDRDQTTMDKPQILQEIIIEELSIDGICGVY